MGPTRHIALWLAAAIISIVVTLAPSAAEAHGHEAHDVSRHAGSAHAIGPRAGVASSEATGHVEMKAASVGGMVLACRCSACAHGGANCCTNALAPTTDWALPAPRPREQVAASETPIPTGIVPEAPPEPPRSFA